MIRLPLLVFLFAAICVAGAGCATSSDKYDSQRKETDRIYEETINGPWKAGYGFNNPNPERMKKGLPPLNFDGTVATEKRESIGDQIVSGIFDSIFEAIGHCLSKLGE